jgi:diguanylate cyclase (GGDEF)-like protein
MTDDPTTRSRASARQAKTPPRQPEDDAAPTLPATPPQSMGGESLWLVALTGPMAGRELPILGAGGILGRGPGSAFHIEDPGVSRRHLRLNVIPDTVRPTRRLVLLQDLESTNGVRVNGQRVRRKILRGGEKIMIGESVLRFERRDGFDAAFYSRLQEMATTDPLTGVGNRLAMGQELERQEAERVRYGRPYSILLVDLDHFKAINDRHGHAAGDRVLREVAVTLLGSLRGADRAFRYGGEEFLVLVPETTREGAEAVAERIRERIEKAPIREGPTRIYVTVSVGGAEAGDDDVLVRADRALYRAKRSGRNRVCFLKAPKPKGSDPARNPDTSTTRL